MSDAQETRKAFAESLRDALSGYRFAVYSDIPSVITVPAIAVGPSSTYRQQDTFSLDTMRLDVVIFLNRLSDAYDSLDTAIDQVIEAAEESNGIYESVSGVGTSSINDTTYLTATVTVSLAITR